MGIDPTMTLSRPVPAISSISRLASDSCCKIISARGRKASPNEVKRARLPKRWNNLVPSSSQFVFELAHLLRKGGLGQMFMLRSASETSCSGDRAEVTKLMNFHRSCQR